MNEAAKQLRADLRELVDGTEVAGDVVKMLAGACIGVLGARITVESKEGKACGSLTRVDGLQLLHEGLGEYLARTARTARETVEKHRKAAKDTEPPPPEPTT